MKTKNGSTREVLVTYRSLTPFQVWGPLATAFACIVGLPQNLYYAVRYPGSSAERARGIVVTSVLILISLYLVIGICRFFGVALMRDPGIRPIPFLDWWWIKIVRFLMGK